MNMTKPSPSPFARHWDLDPDVVFLNHGSFGACPRVVMERQLELRREMEAEPLQFLYHTLEGRIDEAKPRLAQLIGCDAEDLAFVANATAGVNTVLRSLKFGADDELLVTDHEYNACRNALDYVAETSGARVVVAPIPFPIREPQQVVDSVLALATDKTRLCLIDHVTSPTGMVLPIEEIVRTLNERGVDTLVDGAHAPGMLPLDLSALGAAYYTGNCHKWLCTPKGSAILFVRRDRQEAIRPLSISHGANSVRSDRSRFLIEADWTGTHDPTAHLSIPSALTHMAGLVDGGWPAIRDRNHRLALAARELIGPALGLTEHAAPDDALGCMVAFPLPTDPPNLPAGPRGHDPLAHWLWEAHGICVPVGPLPHGRGRFLRISAQLYNQLEQYERLAEALSHLPA